MIVERLRDPAYFESNLIGLTIIIFAVLVFIVTFLASRHFGIILAILKALLYAVLSAIPVFIFIKILFLILKLYFIGIILSIIAAGAIWDFFDDGS